MSAFPTLTWNYTYDSKEVAVRKRVSKRGPDGTLRTRLFFTGKKRLDLRWEKLTQADKDAVDAHLALHEGLAFDFTWRGAVLQVTYTDRDPEWSLAKPGLWDLRLELVTP
ncbi:MAG: hypothetical protein KDH15_04655 [Rhodocyclaceae bacterium]|nr:hypothetical protein [Rhodocyclaceae bacterium]